MRRANMWGAMLLCCSVLVSDVTVLAQGDPQGLLHVDGGAVSADIRAKPLGEVIRALELKTGVIMHFPALQVTEQVITAHFEKLALVAALRAIFKDTNYAIVTGPTEQGVGIQVYVYPKHPGDASTHSPGTSQTEEPMEPPAPRDMGDADPAVRIRELEHAVVSYGPQSLALILAAAHDADPQVQSAAEQLLLNDLRTGVPQETLSTIALSSELAEHRLQALEAVAERQDQSPSARMTLDGALHDTDPQVRQRAEALLSELSASELE